MLPTNVRITSARYANSQNTLVFVLLDSGETWYVIPNNGSGQANVLSAWLAGGGNIGPFVPPTPGGVVPPGSLIWWSSPYTPSGYLFCDGQQVNRKQYGELFSAIGSTFGPGDGRTTFNLPDLRGKMIRGWGPVNSLDPNRQFGSNQGSLLGAHRHNLTDPGHTHGVTDPGHLHPVNDPGHTHGVTDPGHTHPSIDPGHNHGIKMAEDNVAFPALQTSQRPVVLTPYFNRSIAALYYWSPDTEIASANLTVNQGSANVLTAVGQANVSDELDPTFITVTPATTNVTETDFQGGVRTEPANLTLLPFIRY
jgi:microcystin-dependent protein